MLGFKVDSYVSNHFGEAGPRSMQPSLKELVGGELYPSCVLLILGEGGRRVESLLCAEASTSRPQPYPIYLPPSVWYETFSSFCFYGIKHQRTECLQLY